MQTEHVNLLFHKFGLELFLTIEQFNCVNSRLVVSSKNEGLVWVHGSLFNNLPNNIVHHYVYCPIYRGYKNQPELIYTWIRIYL